MCVLKLNYQIDNLVEITLTFGVAPTDTKISHVYVALRHFLGLFKIQSTKATISHKSMSRGAGICIRDIRVGLEKVSVRSAELTVPLDHSTVQL